MSNESSIQVTYKSVRVIDPIDKVIGGVVKEARRLSGLTITGLSKKSKVSRGFICDLENGKRGVSIKTLLMLTPYLPVTLSDFERAVNEQKLYNLRCQQKNGARP